MQFFIYHPRILKKNSFFQVLQNSFSNGLPFFPHFQIRAGEADIFTGGPNQQNLPNEIRCTLLNDSAGMTFRIVLFHFCGSSVSSRRTLFLGSIFCSRLLLKALLIISLPCRKSCFYKTASGVSYTEGFSLND